MQLPSAETSLCAKNKIKKGKKRGAGVGAWWVLSCALSPFPAQGGCIQAIVRAGASHRLPWG